MRESHSEIFEFIQWLNQILTLKQRSEAFENYLNP